MDWRWISSFLEISVYSIWRTMADRHAYLTVWTNLPSTPILHKSIGLKFCIRVHTCQYSKHPKGESIWCTNREVRCRVTFPMGQAGIYIQSKNPPRMATMTFGNFGNPGGRSPRARYTIVDKKARELSFLPSIMHTSSSSVRESRYRRLHAAAVFLTSYI